ncbi:hypothetical protein [Brevibacillus laterosporus]|uniref:hypothetical protein n=1 Tax=Brevibacillus laterosporus TaxID=1465 RepID=UPI003D1F3E9A
MQESTFQQQTFNLIQHLTGQKNLLTVPKVFVEYCNDFTAALLLSQIIFWADRTESEDGYFFKSYKDWEEEICLTEYQVRRSTKRLEELDILETKLKKANGAPTVHYRLKKDQFSESILKFLQNRILKNSRIHSEVSLVSSISNKLLTQITTEDIYIPDSKKPKNQKPKKKYAEFVSMTEVEYEKLVSKHGKALTEKMIEKLDNYKGANGKKYKSDYRAILNWVEEKVLSEQPKGGKANHAGSLSADRAEQYRKAGLK